MHWRGKGGLSPPADLERVIRRYIEACGGALRSLRRRGRHQLRLSANARKTLLEELKSLRQDKATLDFSRWLESSKAPQHVTLDQETALAERDLPFITPAHPLAKAAIAFWQAEQQPLVAHLSIPNSGLAAGLYLAALEMWETVAARPEFRLHGFIWEAKQRRVVPTPESFLSQLANADAPNSTAQLDHVEIKHGLRAINEHAIEARRNEVAELKRINDELVEQQLASQANYYENRLARVKQELEQAENQKITVMKRSQMDRIVRERDAKLSEIEERRACDIVSKRIALCLLQALPE